jgi:hypothetical protein
MTARRRPVCSTEDCATALPENTMIVIVIPVTYGNSYLRDLPATTQANTQG